jgi:hypothetical protein
MAMMRAYRAGESIEDFCRVCKMDRMHTIVVVDTAAQPIRVACGYCRSEHNYRGGPRATSWGSSGRSGERPSDLAPAGPRRPAAAEPFPVVADRERTTSLTSTPTSDLETMIRRVIREEIGLTPVTPDKKWRGGELVLRPGTPGLQEKTWPIETFFHKIVMLRNRLRTLEQQVNAADLPEDVKIRLQGYISGCYGSLTSFNVLFAEDDDQFTGSSGGD